MKNQYFGDVGDYGKYGMLRFLAKEGIKIAVNWYLTADDGSNDGKHISYLESDKDSRYDSELFYFLKTKIDAGERNIASIEKADMIPGAVYYDVILGDEGDNRVQKRQNRAIWHANALQKCSGSELVFLDPDNGACEKEPANAKEHTKYCYADEIADYYEAGQDVVYYCQKGRRTYDQWEEAKAMMKQRLPEARIAAVTYHRGTQRSYIFVLHKEHFRKYAGIIRRFLDRWPKLFTEEYGRTGGFRGEPTGEKMELMNSQGVVMIIEVYDDGWVTIKRSDRKNMSLRKSIDHFMDEFRI